MATKTKVRVGLIGCGVRLRGVAKMLLEANKGIEVVALSDPSKKSIRTAQAELCASNPATVYSDYKDLVKDESINWVMVGSWNCFHREHVVAAFKAGKDVFCEKPLATTEKDCIAMLKAWKASGRQFNIGFTLRYSPHYRKIKELIAKGEIGDIVSMEFNETLDFNHGGFIMGDWRRFTKNAGTHLLEKCSHDIDLANWIVDSRASRVAGFGGLDFFLPKNNKHAKRIGPNKDGAKAYQTWFSYTKNPFTADKDLLDNQVSIIEYENGVRATFHSNCNAGIPERRMYICGTEGTIRADVLTGSIEVKRIGFTTKIRNVKAGVSGGHGGGDTVLAKELGKTMLKGIAPATGLEDGLKSAFTCFAIDKATETGKVVDLTSYWKKID